MQINGNTTSDTKYQCRKNCSRLHHSTPHDDEHQKYLSQRKTNYNQEYRLGQRAALAGGDDITFLDVERRGAVHRHVLMALLETLELADVMQVSASDHDGVLHLILRDAHTLEDTSSDRHVTRERALLVDERALLGFL